MPPARILSIAGSDSGGGAGIQADIKTACAFGVYSSTAITAVTAQNTLEVEQVLAVPPDMVRAQITAVMADIGADAIKIGMLANALNCEAVADALYGLSVPIVLDPVMIATSGGKLLDENAIDVLQRRLLPLANVVTPNLPELDVLASLSSPGHEARLAAAQDLSRAHGCAVLLKDGHGNGDLVEDALITEDSVVRFTAPRLESADTHGTGCTLSTAIACGLAVGQGVLDAVAAAQDFVRRGIKTAPGLGKGHGPINHLQRK